jgi:transcriptional regulator of acetoin/glycerol metabolism
VVTTAKGLTDVLITSGRAGTVWFRAYRVEVVEGPDAGKSIELERGSIVLGSAPDADLRLSDSSVSRAHARLVAFPDGVEVTDLGSKNGTFAAGLRIERARLAPGSELVVGRTHVRLVPRDQETAIEPSENTRFGVLIGRSRAMRETFALLELIATKDTPVLIEGETGTGKERAAKAIHGESHRSQGNLQIIRADSLDAAAPLLPDEVPTNVTSVLVKNADHLSKAQQQSLMEALESNRLGVRFFATTRADLDAAAAHGRFDRALLLRLGVVRVRIPPLRERASDLPMLIEDILAELGRPVFDLGPADLGRMQAYAWPDNVRELRTVIERAVSLEQPPLSGAVAPSVNPAVSAELPYKQARGQMIEAFEREYVRALLAKHDGNVSKAARVAGIDRVYLHRLIRKYGF